MNLLSATFFNHSEVLSSKMERDGAQEEETEDDPTKAALKALVLIYGPEIAIPAVALAETAGAISQVVCSSGLDHDNRSNNRPHIMKRIFKVGTHTRHDS